MIESNLVADPPPGFKVLEPIEGKKNHIPEIQWGEVFKGWKPARQIRYLKALASSMNESAELMQKERNECLKVIEKNEIQIKALHKKNADQMDLITDQMAKFNEGKQGLLMRIQELDRLNGELKKKERGLPHGNEYQQTH